MVKHLKAGESPLSFFLPSLAKPGRPAHVTFRVRWRQLADDHTVL